MQLRIGLFGGSFDPVHNGHLLVAQSAMEEMSLDRLYFIPAAQSPFKPGASPTPGAERVRLLRLALAGNSQFEVDEQELRRGGISYTIDTVRDYAGRFPGAALFYLIGADHIGALPKWRSADELAAKVSFIVVPRPGQPEACLPAPFTGKSLAGFPFGVSASQIRERVRSGKRIDYLTPAAVAEAIRNYRLYL